jgi:tetratricopeptide (TPR) repeat protein
MQSKRIREIEALVVQRKVRRSLLEISKFRNRLPSYLKAPDAHQQVWDWLRRLGLYLMALKSLDLDQVNIKQTSLITPEGQRLLWIARLFGLLGASTYALKLIRLLDDPRTHLEHRILGSIYLANWEFNLAFEHLNRMKALDPNPESYFSRLSTLLLSDSLNGMGKISQACEIVKAQLRVKQEPLLEAILRSALGEYLARAESYEESERSLRESILLFKGISRETRTTDFAVATKWLAYTLGRLGQDGESRTLFSQAKSVLKSNQVKVEAYFDIQRLQFLLHQESELTILKIKSYPNLSKGFLSILPEIHGEFPFTNEEAPFYIDLFNHETKNPKGKQIGLSLNDRFLGNLRLADHNGISMTRMKECLWPDEIHNYLSLEARLFQISNRLKEYKIRVRNGIIYLSKSNFTKISIAGPMFRKPSFLINNRTFFARQVSTYYQISKTQRAKILEGWTKQGVIQRLKKGCYQAI